MRFTKNQLKNLGYNSYCDYCFDFNESNPQSSVVGPSDYIVQDESFAQILDMFVGSFVDGLPNFINPDISESAPDSVKQFFAAFTNQVVPGLLAAPDDETAFDTIIPKDCSYSQYRDIAMSTIKRYSEEYKLKHSGEQ